MVFIKDTKGAIETDPFRNFKFQVRIEHDDIVDGIRTMGFMNMSGLAMTTEVIPYREGGNNTTQRKLPGQTNFSDITLSNGLTFGNTQAWEWTKQLFSYNAGQGGSIGNLQPGNDFRTTVNIFVLAHPYTAGLDVPSYVAFRLYRAWITGLAFSELDAGGNAVFVQQMTLAHEGFDMRTSPSTGVGAAS